MKLSSILAVSIGIVLLACSTNNIDATVEARPAQERTIEATVEARVMEEKTSEPTPKPPATNTSTSTATKTPAATPTVAPAARPLPTPKPTQIPPYTPYPTASPLPTTIWPSPTPAGISVVFTTGKTTERDRDQKWSFTAEEGLFVRIEGGPAEGSGIDVALELFGPDGSLLEVNIAEGVNMPSTGEYLVVVTGAHDTTGDYFLKFTGMQKTNIQLSSRVPTIQHEEASEVNLNFDCNKPYYSSQPAPVSSDTVHRYYEYYWQSNLEICINVYEPDLIDDYWEARISELFTFARDTLGLVVPVNVTVLDQRNSSPETLNQVNIDECSLRVDADLDQLVDCVTHSDDWGNRFNSAGIDARSLLNGGHVALFAGTWEGYESDKRRQDETIKVFMHEYFHIHQNALKFYFESRGQFGIPIAWEDDPGRSIHEEPATKPWVFPNWIEEGGAEFAGLILAAKFDSSINAELLFEEALDEARSVVLTAANNGDTVSLRDYEYQGGLYESAGNPNNGIAREYAYQYTGGAWALMYLWSLDENNLRKSLIDYYKNWGEQENLNPGNAWKDSFETTFGVTLEEFYTDFDAFMLQSKESQMAILKTNAQMNAAAITP